MVARADVGPFVSEDLIQLLPREGIKSATGNNDLAVATRKAVDRGPLVLDNDDVGLFMGLADEGEQIVLTRAIAVNGSDVTPEHEEEPRHQAERQNPSSQRQCCAARG